QNHGVWSSLGRSLETLEPRSLKLPYLVYDEPSPFQVAIEFRKCVARDWLALGRAQLFQALGSLLELGIEPTDTQPRQRSLHAVDDTTLLANKALMLTARPLGIFLRETRDARHPAVITLAA